MPIHVTRRSLLTGFATALGSMTVDAPLARARAPRRNEPDLTSDMFQPITLSVPFGAGGLMGSSEDGQAYLEHLIKAAIVPPLSDVVIYAHGWLTDADDLMVIYDTAIEGYGLELRTLGSDMQARAAPRPMAAPPLALPASTLVITTHWPSRRSDGGPIGLSDLASFSVMEARANLVGRTGMARLIGLIWERLLADPDLASTRLALVSHSFGGRVMASALNVLPHQAPDAFAALQTRNRIKLVMFQPAMPADALEPDTLTQAHPFAQLVNYRNLRTLVTMSRWDTALRRFYPAEEAQQPSDAAYAADSFNARKAIPALGGAGPTDATWRAFNGGLPTADVSVGPGFRYSDVLRYTNQRLVVADLTALHAAHHLEDLGRPAGQLPPFGRPDRRTMALVGYHSDIFCPEIYQLNIGFAFASRRSPAVPS